MKRSSNHPIAALAQPQPPGQPSGLVADWTSQVSCEGYAGETGAHPAGHR